MSVLQPPRALMVAALAALDPARTVRAHDLRRAHRCRPRVALALCAALASRGVLIEVERVSVARVYRVDGAQLARAREWWAAPPSVRSIAQTARRNRERAEHHTTRS